MAKVLFDRARTGCYLEQTVGDLFYSNDTGTLAAGLSLEAGTVLGRRTADKMLVAFDPDGDDGSESVAGILYGNEDSTDAAKRVAFTRRAATINGHELIWPEGISAAAKDAATEVMADDMGLVVRF